jgi:hypothetical protein
MLPTKENEAGLGADLVAQLTPDKSSVPLRSSVDSYARLVQRERQPNPLRDLSHVWEALTSLTDAPESGSVRARARVWAEGKGFSIETLDRMNVRYRVNKHGGVVLAYDVRCDHATTLPGGIVCGIKYRDLDPEGRKFCEPGTRLSYPAMPSMYGSSTPRRVFVCEGESDASWLVSRAQATDSVYCLHGGAGLWFPEWTFPLERSGADAYIATDNDWDRPRGNIGDELAERIARDLPGGSERLRPPFPARDWCEVGR